MSTTVTQDAVRHRLVAARVATGADHAVQLVADASVWLVFRLSDRRRTSR
ncbi:MAG: hypothetical protein JWN84_2571 [Nocardioides sp.]|nr:hypothetical protein [Nocardioides sp.]